MNVGLLTGICRLGEGEWEEENKSKQTKKGIVDPASTAHSTDDKKESTKTLCITDDQGFVCLWNEEELLQQLKEAHPHVDFDRKTSNWPCDDPDYMAELKITRDMKIYQTVEATAPKDETLTQVSRGRFFFGILPLLFL